ERVGSEPPDGDLLALELDLLARAALGSEGDQLGDAEVASFENLQHLAAHGAGRAGDGHFHLPHLYSPRMEQRSVPQVERARQDIGRRGSPPTRPSDTATSAAGAERYSGASAKTAARSWRAPRRPAAQSCATERASGATGSSRTGSPPSEARFARAPGPTTVAGLCSLSTKAGRLAAGITVSGTTIAPPSIALAYNSPLRASSVGTMRPVPPAARASARNEEAPARGSSRA